MPIKNIDDDHESNRLSLLELRKINKFRDVSDEEGEAIIDDAIAMVRMVLTLIK